MAEGYAMQKSMGFVRKYMQDFVPMRWKVWDTKEEKNVSGEVLEAAGKAIDLGVTIQDIAHHYVLTNTIAMAT